MFKDTYLLGLKIKVSNYFIGTMKFSIRKCIKVIFTEFYQKKKWNEILKSSNTYNYNEINFLLYILVYVYLTLDTYYVTKKVLKT